MNEEYLNELAIKYRNLVNNDKIDINKLDKLISNEDLIMLIKKNNDDLQKMVNESPIGIENNSSIKELFLINTNLYRLAKHRDLNIPDFSFMRALASAVNVPFNDSVMTGMKNLTKKR